MNNPGVGGRGKKATYDSVHYRIPEPIKPVVKRFAAAYRILVGSGIQENCDRLLQNVDSALVNTLEGEKHQITIHEGIIEKLQNDLTILQSKVDKLQKQQIETIKDLTSTLEFKPQQGTKIQGVIKQVIASLKEE